MSRRVLIAVALCGLLASPSAKADPVPYASADSSARPQPQVLKRGWGGSEIPPPNIAQIASTVGDGLWDNAPMPQWNRPSAGAGRGPMPRPGVGAPYAPVAPPAPAAGPPDAPAAPRVRFTPPSTRDSSAQRNLLKTLGTLVNRSIHMVSDTARLFQRTALLRNVSRTMPDLSVDPSGIRLDGARDSQLLTLAPGALQRFERRIDVLHMMGVRHNDIRPENIVIDRYGELQLVDWERAGKGGDAEVDLLGVDAVRRFLQQRLGS